MATVSELVPGDLVTSAGMSAVFIARTIHPDHPTLMLVVWRLCAALGGDWSFDALHPLQHVGDVTPSTIADRVDRLRTAFTAS